MKDKVERFRGKMGGVTLEAGLTKDETKVRELNALSFEN